MNGICFFLQINYYYFIIYADQWANPPRYVERAKAGHRLN